MGKPLRILFVEDSGDDVELLLHELQRGGFEPVYERVDTGEALAAALDRQEWDALLADYNMPGFSALSTLKMVQERGLDIPFIVVSEAISEEGAVTLMKAGAHDYIMKGNLKRLLPALERELRDAEIRQKQKKTEDRLKVLFEYAPDAYYLNDSRGAFLDGNRAAEELTGYKRKELIGKNFLEMNLIPRGQAERADALLARNVKGEATGPDEFVLRHKDGRKVPVEIRTYPVDIGGQTLVLRIARDISQRKKVEALLQESEKRYRSLVDNALVGVYQTDLSGRILFVNKALAEIFGFGSPKEMMVQNVMARYRYPADREAFVEVLKKKRKIANFEAEVVTKKGETRNVIISGSLKGHVISGMIRDITDLKSAERALIQGLQRLQDNLNETVYSLSTFIEKRDPYTAGHQWRVTQLAMAIGREMNLSESQIEGIRIAGYLHDIGKISVPAEILTKPSRLTDTEMSIIQTHPQTSYEIIKNINFPWPVADIVRQHHERIDGSGYPEGLSGKAILLEAKILAVADVVEAMSSHRPYRPALGTDKALEEIMDKKGILFDQTVVNACLNLFRKKGYHFEKNGGTLNLDPAISKLDH